MAQVSRHTRNDSGVSVHSVVVHDNPPSPTLTNPDLIIPIEPWQTDADFEGPHPLLEPQIPSPQIVSNHSLVTNDRRTGTSRLADSSVVTFEPISTSQAAHIETYSGYEHGAPLSDIYEESEANATPTKSTIRSHSTTPPQSPTPINEQSPSILRPVLRHKKRNSSLSTSSGGSDVGDWETFDTSKVLSGRVAADLEQMRREETLEVDDRTSRRQSREEEELAALNARAEKILENARKRLTHMEDNLKTARNSVLIPSKSSPHLGDYQQPVGGLYRSISAAGASKLGKRPVYPPIKTSASLQHMRAGSDASGLASSKRPSRSPEIRSASAMDYGSAVRYSLFPDITQSPTNKYQASPTAGKGLGSMLPTLGEEYDSPEASSSTPDSTKIPLTRGLGIHASAAISRENVGTSFDRSSSRQTPTPTQHVRASSSTSIRSTQSLKDQMSDLKSRIADLKSKTQAENLRRQSFQSLRSSSPFTSGQPEQFYASSPAYNDSSSPISIGAGIGSRASGMESPSASRGLKPNEQEEYDLPPFTPANGKYLNVDRLTPSAEIQHPSSARTDRNDPLFARNGRSSIFVEAEDDVASVVQAPQTQRPSNDVGVAIQEDHEVEQIAENEEEQIYLNEVLEESLREAEVEPEVPLIPGSFLPSPDGIPAVGGSAPERHEDRIDAFDYENMFLHSAMGTYTGKSLNGSVSGSESDSDGDTGSVETSRMDARTPVDESDHSTGTGPSTDYGMDHQKGHEKLSGNESDDSGVLDFRNTHIQRQLRSPAKMQSTQSPKAWVHVRNNSVDSVSTAATFQTATEGGEEDEEENPMLNWDPTPASSLGYSPNTHQVYHQNSSPKHPKHGFSSPRNGGRVSAIPKQFPSPPSRTVEYKDLGQAQYVNRNGVSDRYNDTSPHHSRQSSVATVQPFYRPGSVATVKAMSPLQGLSRGQIQQDAANMSRTPPTPNNRPSRSFSGSAGSPTVITVTSSPQRKVVVNRSLQQPQSFILEPQTQPPPDMPLPEPPGLASSAALQAQLQSPKQGSVKSPRRSASNLKRSPVTPPLPQPEVVVPQMPVPVPNTEILMESLIKLADPNFTLAPGMMFADIDKELVLGLLRAVGSVVDGVLRAGAGRSSIGEEEAFRIVSLLRGRLEGATNVLEGVEVRKSGEKMREV